jgi:hypothetical protein
MNDYDEGVLLGLLTSTPWSGRQRTRLSRAGRHQLPRTAHRFLELWVRRLLKMTACRAKQEPLWRGGEEEGRR